MTAFYTLIDNVYGRENTLTYRAAKEKCQKKVNFIHWERRNVSQKYVKSFSQFIINISKMKKIIQVATAFRNHNRTVFEEMTSWTALSWHIGKKTTF